MKKINFNYTKALEFFAKEEVDALFLKLRLAVVTPYFLGVEDGVLLLFVLSVT